jgi:hypothetical protein
MGSQAGKLLLVVYFVVLHVLKLLMEEEHINIHASSRGGSESMCYSCVIHVSHVMQ